jgi:hypothetical protein
LPVNTATFPPLVVDEEEEVSSLLEEKEQVVSNDFTLHNSAVDRGCVIRQRNDGDEKIMLLSSSSSFMVKQ